MFYLHMLGICSCCSRSSFFIVITIFVIHKTSLILDGGTTSHTILLSPGEIKAITMIMVSRRKTGSPRASIRKVIQLLFQPHSNLSTSLVFQINYFFLSISFPLACLLALKLKLHVPINVTDGLVSFLTAVHLLIDSRFLWCNLSQVILPPIYVNMQLESGRRLVGPSIYCKINILSH